MPCRITATVSFDDDATPDAFFSSDKYTCDYSDDDDNAGGPPTLDLTAFDGDVFSLRWFDPRTGAFIGPAFTLIGGDWVNLGPPPDGFSRTNDWALLVQIPEPASGLLVTLALAVLLARQPRHGPALAYR